MRLTVAAMVVVALAAGASLIAQRATPVHPAALVPKAVTTIAAKQIVGKIGVSEMTAAPGGKVTLIVDVIPKPTMHVYAPGQEGYQAIEITIAPQSSFTLAATTYPAAKRMFFEELQQTLKVYDAPFRLTRDVTFASSAHGSIAITGTLDYQACDDHVCYRSDQAAIKWSIDVR